MTTLNEITTPTIVINNIPVFIVPNSFEFTEGTGEQAMRVASAGGASTVSVYSDDVKTHLSEVKFKVYSVDASIDNIKIWKANRAENVITASANVTGDFTRTFNGAALLNEPKVTLGADSTVDFEWKSSPAV
jgi:hypothetical protein